jgi:O-antigen ligase
VIGPRPLATYLLIILSLGLAEWRYALNKTYRVRGALISLLSLSIIVFTLSRTATATALLLFAIFTINPNRLWKLLPSALLAIILSASLLFGIPSLRARLFHASPSNLSEARKYLVVSGRDIMWPVTFNHALEKPIFGWGPGSARLLLGSHTPNREEHHPHNEYLQVFHDTGIIGLVLLLSAWLLLIVNYWKRWKFAHLSKDILRAKWNMAATLNILLVLINAVVDNTLHYTFIIAPVFIIIGCTDFLNNSLRYDTP